MKNPPAGMDRMKTAWKYPVGTALWLIGVVRLIYVFVQDAHNVIEPTWYVYSLPLVLMFLGLLFRGMSYRDE